MEDLEDTQALNDRLREMVNKSSVDAVDKANAERKQTLRDCEKKIKEINLNLFTKLMKLMKNSDWQNQKPKPRKKH